MCSKDELLNRDNPIRKSNGVLKFISFLVLVWMVLLFGLKTAGYGQEIPSTPTALGYRNFFYKTGSVTSEVTEEKPQSKVWHNDGFWWGVLWEPNTKVYRIHRYNLSAHSWVNVGPDVDERPRSAADVLWDGSKLYIASNAKLSHTSSQGTENIKIYRYSYNSGTNTYSLDNGFPVQLSNSGKTRSLTIAKDSNGKLWVTWTENAKVMVNRTLGSDINWGTAFVLPAQQNDLELNTNGATIDISDIIAFGGNKIGILWGNQNPDVSLSDADRKYFFSTHNDNDTDTNWQAREDATPGFISTSASNPVADDHINLACDIINGIVVAVLKTGFNGGGNPRVLVSKRATNGAWSPAIFSTTSESHTRPIIVYDSGVDSVFVFAKDDASNRKNIVMKSAHINNLTFPSGVGKLFMQSDIDDNLNNVTSTKQSVDSSTGLLVLGSDKDTGFYVHNYLVPGNAAPQAVDDTFLIHQNTTAIFNVLGNDSDSDGAIAPATVGIVQAPAHGAQSVNSTTGEITYTPNTGFSGSDSFQYTVRDNDGVSAFAATVNVTVNALPAAGDDVAGTTEETSVDIDVTVNDSDLDGGLNVSTVALVSGANHGAATVNATNGIVTYTPNLNFVGTDSFVYTVNDNHGATSNAATVTVTVTDVNDPPVAANDSAAIDQGVPVVIDVTLNDSDIDGSLNLASVTVLSAPANGSTAVSPTGEITYTSNASFFGTDSLIYTVADDDGAASNSAKVILSVNALPIAVRDSTSTDKNVTQTVDVTANDNDPDGSIDVTTVNIVTQPQNGTASATPAGAITYTPNSSYSGADSLEYSVRDNLGSASNVTSLFIKINNPPVAVSDSVITNKGGSVDIDVTSNDTDSDGTVAVGTVTIINQPFNGSASVNTSGVITYTPNPVFAGNDVLTYQVKDNDGAVSNTASVFIEVNVPPSVSDDVVTTNEDSILEIDVAANDSDPDGSLDLSSVSIVSAPNNGTTAVSSSTGAVTYTPQLNFNGNDSFTYTISDDDGAVSNTASVVITVVDVNDPPVASDDNTTTDEEIDVTIDVLVNDNDIDGLLNPATVTIVTSPGQGTAQVNPVSGEIQYSPAQDFAGSDSLTYTVNDDDGAASSPAMVRITVNDVNDAPVAHHDTVGTNEDVPISVSVLSNDTDIDGLLNPASVSVVSQPGNGSVTVKQTGEITYTPFLNFVGNDIFTYSVEDDDAALSNVATVAVTVGEVNDPPVAVDDTVSTSEETPAAIAVLSNDSDVDGTLAPETVAIVNQPANGSASVDPATGEITYTPALNFMENDSLSYTVADSGGAVSNVATVRIAVVDVNDPPVARNDSVSTNKNMAVSFEVVSNDSDIDGTVNPASVTVTTPPTQGSAGVDGAGMVTYTPATGFAGIDSVLYTVKDNNGALSNSAVVILLVNDAPIAVNDTVLTVEETPVTIDVAANDLDSDGTIDPATVTILSSPNSGSVTVSSTTGLVTYTPNANFFGNDTFSYSVQDNNGATSNAATVHVEVNRPPVALNDVANTNEDVSVDIAVLNNDVDLDGTLNLATVTLQTGPSHGVTSVNTITGEITYAPDADFSGTDSFSYTVLDNDGALSNTATVTVNVNDAPIAFPDIAVAHKNGAVSINVVVNDTDSDGTIAVSTVAIATAPNNGATSVNPNTGVVTFTPNPGYTGADSFVYTVDDNEGARSDSTTVTLRVNNPPLALNDTGLTIRNFSVDVVVLDNDSDSDGVIDTSTVTVISQPGNGIATANLSGLITYIPNVNFSGTDFFSYKVEDDDGGASNQAFVTMTVLPNSDPVAVDDIATTAEDTPVVVDVLANDNDPDLDGSLIPATVTVVNSPAHGSTSIDPATGTISYSPELNYFGSDSLTYHVKDDDNATSNDATVRITVTDVNDNPVAVNDTSAANEQAPVIVDVVANDSDVDGVIDPTTVAVTGQPASGVVTIDAGTGAVTYTSNSGFSGEDTFTYSVQDDDSGVSNPATVSIFVNDSPVAVDDAVTINEETPVVINVLLNDFDTDGSIGGSSVTVVNAPVNGAASVDTLTGEITYTPAQNYVGQDSLTYSITDNDAATSNLGTVRISVTDVNDPPVAVNDTSNTNEEVPVNIDVAANDFDIDGSVISTSVALLNNPTNGTASVDGAGDILYTPNTDFFGVDSLTYTVDDEDAATSNMAIVFINVADVNDPPVAVNDTSSTNEITAITINVIANDSDSDGNIDPATLSVTLVSNGATSLSSTGEITYTPNPNFSGTDTFTYSVRDDDGALSNTATVFIHVNDSPIAKPDTVSTFENQTVVFNPLANDTDTDGTLNVTSVTLVSAPTNGSASIDPVNGEMTYTPNLNFDGPDSFSYTVTDNQASVSNSATVLMTVTNVNNKPIAKNDTTATPEDAAVSIDIFANDSDSDGVIEPTTVAIVSQPQSGSLVVDPATGEVTYTPAAHFFGQDIFTYTVADNDNEISNVATVLITVAAVNDPPVARNDTTVTVEDTPVVIAVAQNDSDVEGTLAPTSVSVVSNPAHGFTSVDAATGNITYTPDLNFAGADSFGYNIADAEGARSDTAKVLVTVTPVDDAPVAVNDTASTPEETSITINVVSNDSDSDGNLDLATISIVTPPGAGSAASDLSGRITYTPGLNFQGADSLHYTIKDNAGQTSNIATVLISVTGVNDDPVATNDTTTTSEDTPVTLDVAANDSDAEGSLDLTSVMITNPPVNGTAVVSGTLGITYTPDTDFFGSDSLRYKIKDDAGATSNEATLLFNVTSVNDAPVAVNDTVSTPEDQLLVISVTANDTDVDGSFNFSTINLLTNPNDGFISVDGSTGTVTYNPQIDFFGMDSFTYSVEDNDGAVSNVATVLIDVVAVNDAPVALNDTSITVENVAVVIPVTSNDSDLEGTIDLSSVAVVNLPAIGVTSVDAVSGDVTYTPNTGFVGGDNFTYTVSDNEGLASNQATVSVTIVGESQVPTAGDDAVSTLVNTAVIIPILANDSDSDGTLMTNSIIVNGGPANGVIAIAPATGDVIYTPNNGFVGSDTFNYTVRDNSGLTSNTAIVSITVHTDVLTFNPTDDAYVVSSLPTINRGTASELRSQDSGSILQNTYLKFSVTGIFGAIVSAKLSLMTVDGSDNGGAVYAVSNNFLNTGSPWSENGITFNNAPSISGTPLHAVGQVTAGTKAEFDVTAAISVDGTISFAIKGASADAAKFSSKEGATLPVLVIRLGLNGPDVPMITSFNPGSAPVGTEVTFSGSHFTTASAMSFNGTPANGFSIDSDSQMRAIVPAGATTGKINVTNAIGPGSSLTDFAVIIPPSISSFTPLSGPVNTEVTLTGSNFTGVSAVTIGGTSAASFAFDSDTQIRVVVPATASDGAITVTNAAGSAASQSPFDVLNLPQVVSFSPATGVVGVEVTLSGTHFTGATDVTFNGASAASFSVDSDTQLRAAVPNNATSGSIGVVNADGSGSSGDSFTVISPPTLSAFTPTSGVTGSEVTLTGNSLSGTTGVLFNGVAAASVTVDSDTQVRAVVPNGATTGKMTVSNQAGSATSANNFQVLFIPAILSFTPVNGPAGTEVTITGSNFSGTNQVKFNAALAVSFTVDTDTQIRATVPAGAITGPVSVTNNDGTAVSSGDFNVNQPPAITSFTPTSGEVNTEVTLFGSNFTGVSNVAFNGASALTVVVDVDTAIRVIVPVGAGTGKISLTNIAGSVTSANNFTVLALPRILTFTPSNGPAGAEVTLNGENFSTTTSVAFNGTSTPVFIVDSNTQIRATVPAHAATGPVSVTNSDGTTASATDFIVLLPPNIVSFTPSNGPVGTEVTLIGSHFTGVSSVSFSGALSLSLTTDSDNQIRAVVPTTASSGLISVTSSAGTGASASSFTVTAPNQTMTFNPTDDAFVLSTRPLNNFGNVNTLRARVTASAEHRSFLKFNVSGVTGTVFSAVLRLRALATTGDGGSIYSVSNNFAGTTTPWNEGGLLFGNAPAISGAPLSSAGTILTGQTVEFDVTSAIIGNGTYSFGISNQSRVVAKYSSTEGTAMPELIVTIAGAVSNLPVITSLSPTSGVIGSEVTILGSNFTGATLVSFKGASASSFTVDSDGQIRATVPAGAHTGAVSVVTGAGTANSGTNFTVVSLPSLSNFTPASGSAGTEVTITGSGLSGATSVAFNGALASSFSIDSDSQIRAVVSSAASSGPISVVNPVGTGVSGSSFVVTKSPGIVSFSPTSGVAGTEVTVSGVNFTGATNVSFNGTAASSFTIDSDSQIRATVPALATTGLISITNSVGSGVSSASFLVVALPSITAFSPASGPAGSQVTLSGSHFSGASVVAFNGISATFFTVDSDGQISAAVPSGATTGPISVTNAAGTTTGPFDFTVTTSSGETLTFNPTDDSFVRSSRPTRNYGNDDELRVRLSSTDYNTYLKFNITGLTASVQSAILRLFVIDGGLQGGSLFKVSDNFLGATTPWSEGGLIFNNAPALIGAPVHTLGQVSLNATVEFDVTAAVTGNGFVSFAISNENGNTVKYSSKEGVAAPQLVVTTGSGGASNPPAILSFTPQSGSPGTEVTLAGSNFTGTTTVAFNGASAGFTVDSGTQLRATVPTGAATGGISVTNPDGTAASASNFTVTTSSSPPSITTFSPASGAVGTEVTLTGSGFTGSTVVTFNGASAGFTVDSGTQLRATVPAGATSGVISVTNPDGTATSASDFTVTTSSSPPNIASFSPASGAVGTEVTLTGSGFTGSTLVTFNGTTASFTVDSDTQVRATVTSGATTGLISITNNIGTDISPSSFTVTVGNPPVITSFTPGNGPIGTEVTLTGGNFTSVFQVLFNGTAATVFVVDSDTQMRATVPSGASTGLLSASNSFGSAFSSAGFIVDAASGGQTLTFHPSDDAFVRSSRPTKNYANSRELRVRLSSTDYDSYLKFNITGLSGSVQSAVLRLFVIDDGLQGGAIYSVSNNFLGTATPWTQGGLIFNNAPEITGTPLSTLGPVTLNQTVEFDLTAAITGNGSFSFAITNQHSNAVKYSSKEGVSVPELIVTTGSGGGASNPPVISAFSPNSGAVGAEVTLTGSFFTGTTGVAFNGTPASFVVDFDSQLRATVPAGAATGKISVTTGEGAAVSASDFAVSASSNFPSIASFTPSSGPVGTEVTILGADLTGSTTVAFNGLPAVFALDSDSQIRATVPSGATTGKISVSNGSGTAISGLDFTVDTGGSGGTLSFQVAEDAYIRSSRPTSNYGSDNELKVRTSSAIRSAYLKFNVNGVSGSITSAVIRMQVIDGSNDGGSVFSVSNNYLNTVTPWDEEGVVWSNAPAIAGTALNSVGAVSLNDVVEFDVTAAIIGDGTFSFAIRSSSSNLANYSSKEGVRAPELVVSTGVSKQKAETNGHTNDEPVETDDAVLPTKLALFPNYPNPFNAETNIEYALPQDTQVKLGIFNVRGQLIKMLVDVEQDAGIKRVRWDGKNRDEKDVGSGVYFLRLDAGEHKFSRKITLQK